MSSYRYEIHPELKGHFNVHDMEGEIINIVDSIWFAVNLEDNISFSYIIKHGDFTSIKKWFDNLQSKLRSNGDKMSTEMADNVVMIDATKWPTEEINHALAAHNYIGKLMKDYKLFPETEK